MTSQQRAIRTFDAPTRPEAEAMAVPVVDAFAAAGWTEQERLWIPGDRRVGLGESMLLNAEDQVLLEAGGTLRIAWITEDEAAVEPAVAPAERAPDTWEQIGGTRYRRLVPRWAIGLVVFAVGGLLMLAMINGMTSRMPGPIGLDPAGFPAFSGFPSFSGFPPNPDGSCPDGYALEINGPERVCWQDEYFEFMGSTPAPQP